MEEEAALTYLWLALKDMFYSDKRENRACVEDEKMAGARAREGVPFIPSHVFASSRLVTAHIAPCRLRLGSVGTAAQPCETVRRVR